MTDAAPIRAAQRAAVAALGRPGDWLDAERRTAVWREVRAARTDPLDLARRSALTPAAVDGAHGESGPLPAAAVEVAHRIASDPGRLTRAWADAQIAALGEETYTEIVGVTAIATTVDRFHRAVGEPEPPVPAPAPGAPTGHRPDGVGDVGAWVAQTTGPTRANVSRTLSLVPVTDAAWRELVDSHYSRGAEFFEPVWDRALSRPQAELLAARTTALEQCFY